MILDFNCNEYYEYSKYEGIYNHLLFITSKILDLNPEYSFDVCIVDNNFIKEVNNSYRKIDKETDVITFAFLDDENFQLLDGINNIGQIIISYEKAYEQSKTYNHTLEREMSFLFIHGLLHLLGFDHINKEDEIKMFTLQEKILGEYKMNKELLIKEALEARKKSYSPYSKFAVGSALLCKDGSIFHGANIENAAYPMCMCSERNAIYNAYMNGKTKDDFVALALIADTPTPCSPCGACRQVLSELFPCDAPIYMCNIKGEVQETTIKELLPYAFDDSGL